MSALRNSRTARRQVRGFATSTHLRIGPESPQFIETPRLVQPNYPTKPRIKGTLPVPRELFPPRRADKPGKQYLDEVTPLPATKRKVNPRSADSEKQAFKIKMAEMRRQNLREGLRKLYSRKQQTEQTMSERSTAKQARRERVFQQPEPEDERFTRASIVQTMLPQKLGTLPDPNREARLALSKARMEAKQAEKEVQRQEDIQSLYMNARTFIVTEEQLAAEIDRVFPAEGENEAWRNDHQQGENIWNLGTPPTVQSIVNETRRSETARWDTIQRRVKQLGEQITGGKL